MTVLKVNRRILKKITNPSVEPYEIEIDTPEFTFYGAKNQPDFASINISMIPGKSVIELKSFKLYLHQYRNKLASYERIINAIYDDLIQVYKPCLLYTSPSPRDRQKSRMPSSA